MRVEHEVRTPNLHLHLLLRVRALLDVVFVGPQSKQASVQYHRADAALLAF